MRKSTLKALAQQEARLVNRLRAIRDRIAHLETVNEGLRYELETERRERIRQIDFVTQILGPLVADLEHRAEQPGADSETRAGYREVVEATEDEEDRQVSAHPDEQVLRSYTPEGLIKAFGEGCS